MRAAEGQRLAHQGHWGQLEKGNCMSGKVTYPSSLLEGRCLCAGSLVMEEEGLIYPTDEKGEEL